MTSVRTRRVNKGKLNSPLHEIHLERRTGLSTAGLYQQDIYRQSRHLEGGAIWRRCR